MNGNKKDKVSSVSKVASYEEIGEYWDTHSLADHWNETSEAEFDVKAKRSHRITLAADVYEQIEVEAQSRGVVPEKLVNILLAERLGELGRN
jgi:hypothetical protein